MLNDALSLMQLFKSFYLNDDECISYVPIYIIHMYTVEATQYFPVFS